MREVPQFEKANDIIAIQVAIAVQKERARCSLVAQLYPVESYDDSYDAIRIRDDISQAIEKGLAAGLAIT